MSRAILLTSKHKLEKLYLKDEKYTTVPKSFKEYT
jgi:hypothetical protein